MDRGAWQATVHGTARQNLVTKPPPPLLVTFIPIIHPGLIFVYCIRKDHTFFLIYINAATQHCFPKKISLSTLHLEVIFCMSERFISTLNTVCPFYYA